MIILQQSQFISNIIESDRVEAMAQPRNQSIQEKECWDLYNRLQAPWNLVIIDIRSHTLWSNSHIVNSINIPNDIKLSNEQLLNLLQTNQNKKSKIAIGMLYYIISDRNNDYSEFIQLLESLTHKHINDKIPFYHLNKSFCRFYYKYSFLCIPDMLQAKDCVIKLDHKTDENKEEKISDIWCFI